MSRIKLYEEYGAEGEAIRLRTLTKKSLMTFGKYHDWRLGDLINMGKQEYLIWCYYNLSMISFMPDILDELGITEEWRIEKPGIDEDLFFKLKKEITMNKTDLERMKDKSHRDKESRLDSYRQSKQSKYKETKNYMQKKNHGKI